MRLLFLGRLKVRFEVNSSLKGCLLCFNLFCAFFYPNDCCSAEGCVVASANPLITAGTVLGVGFLGLKSMSIAFI